jgi:hypothetical protein
MIGPPHFCQQKEVGILASLEKFIPFENACPTSFGAGFRSREMIDAVNCKVIVDAKKSELIGCGRSWSRSKFFHVMMDIAEFNQMVMEEDCGRILQ